VITIADLRAHDGPILALTMGGIRNTSNADVWKAYHEDVEAELVNLDEATLRLAGLPVGSGVTESTCKTVFGHRTKRSGQRWRVPTLRGVVTLRALLQSERLPSFWQRLSLRYAANVEAA
jgi:hypothetical protein